LPRKAGRRSIHHPLRRRSKAARNIGSAIIYVVSGTPTLVLGDQEFSLRPGDCCGFKASSGVGHQLVNRSAAAVLYLEIGDRTAGDYASYPRDDLGFTKAPDGSWILTHKDGTPY
jgi:uncharacterized cupin superfamily protein